MKTNSSTPVESRLSQIRVYPYNVEVNGIMKLPRIRAGCPLTQERRAEVRKLANQIIAKWNKIADEQKIPFELYEIKN